MLLKLMKLCNIMVGRYGELPYKGKNNADTQVRACLQPHFPIIKRWFPIQIA